MKVITVLQPYAKYKKSRESWLGEIPEHWEEKKFKHIFSEKKKKTNVELNCGSISFGKVVYKDDEKVPEFTKRSYQVLSKGDFLINPLNLNYDLISLRIALSDKDVVVSSGYIILNENLKLNKDYYKWLLHIFDVVYMKTLGSGVRQTLSFTHIANCELVFPPIQEQITIANFLEDKTAKIDQAIVIKQKQIELLKERLQILIHKAVTRGLKPNVKLKDSSVEWIGEIPEHWEVKRLASFGKFSKGGGFSKADLVEEGLQCILYGDIYTRYDIKITEVNRFISNDKIKTSILLNDDDILFTGSGETMEDIGKCVVFKNQKITVAGGDVIIFKQTQNNSLYLSYALNTEGAKFEKARFSKGEIIVHTYGSKLRNIYIPIPPNQEQKEIAEYIETASTKIATAISLKEQEIEKLKEYKMSLIDGVVTGKVRVC